MTSHIARLVKRAARRALFGPRTRPMTTRERIQAKADQLRRELAASKLRDVEVHLLAFRAVDEALQPEAFFSRSHERVMGEGGR